MRQTPVTRKQIVQTLTAHSNVLVAMDLAGMALPAKVRYDCFRISILSKVSDFMQALRKTK